MDVLILIAFYLIMGLVMSFAFYCYKCNQFTKEAKINKYLCWDDFSDREEISSCCMLVTIGWIVVFPLVFLCKVTEIVAKSIRKYFNIED